MPISALVFEFIELLESLRQIIIWKPYDISSRKLVIVIISALLYIASDCAMQNPYDCHPVYVVHSSLAHCFRRLLLLSTDCTLTQNRVIFAFVGMTKLMDYLG